MLLVFCGSCLLVEWDSPRPVLTASRPSQTMAQMGPEFMSDCLLVVVLPVIEPERHTGDKAREEGLVLEVSV